MKIFGKQIAKAKPPVVSRRHPDKAPGRPSFSYYSSQRSSQTHNERGKEPRSGTVKFDSELLKEWTTRFGTLVLVVVAVACVVSLLQVDDDARIVIINNSEGYALHSQDKYHAAAVSSLHSSLVNSNKITIDTGSVASKIKQQFPEIADVTVVLPLVGHRPTVYIQLVKPVLILQTARQSVVVDNSGHALVTAENASNLARFNLPILIDQSGLRLKVGDPVFSSSSVKFLTVTLAQLAAQKVAVGKLVLPSGTEELDVYIGGQPYYAKFNLHESNASQQAGTFLAVQQQLRKQGITPSSYIDVRIAGRAYYK